MALRAVRALVAALALALAVACDVPQQQQPALEIGVVVPITHLDPARGDEPATAIVARFVFETLPQLASRITHSRDFSHWTFELPAGRRFSDGTMRDAPAVAANFARWQHALREGERFATFDKTFGRTHAIVSVSAPDATHVVIVVRPQIGSALRSLLSDPHFAIASPHAFADEARFDRGPVGSGPYVVASDDPSTAVVLLPFRYRFETDDAATIAARSAHGIEEGAYTTYRSVRIDAIPDSHTAVLSLDKNDVSVVYGFPATYLDEARADQMNPVREPETGLWCAFAVGLAKVRRQCPPGASLDAPNAERRAL